MAEFSFDNLTSSLVDELPPVQQHAIDSAAEDAAIESPVESTASPDAFNPLIHATGSDGNGVKTRTGAWRKKRKSKSQESTIGAPVETGPSKSEVSARAGGIAAANLLIVMGIGIGGDEWHPRVDQSTGMDEKRMLETAFGDYFVATGKADLPPGWALAAAIGMYTLPRFYMPKTKQRVSNVWQWFKAKWVSWRLRKHGLKAVPNEKEREEKQSDAR